ncbi:YhdP family protein [Neptuniibacter sp. CAU 1671]|uniref:YhdP family protein n=1 Tax=Neptuniibacter sp. CAU 1671 TaxID=3032593 RepID=UPI0023DB1B2B|nr:YhdP family protein [Neptuniibacter sp. CAU 1671]MDF2182218.1 YhdP family protein [Neptuniibacter sp. CAU 1671]
MSGALNRIFWGLYWLLVLTLSVSALLLLTFRLLWPQLNGHQAALVDLLSQRLNSQVALVSMDAQWQEGYPSLHLQGLKLQGIAGQPELALSLNQAYLALDLTASLRQLRPVFNRLELDGLHLKLTQPEQTSQTLTHPPKDLPAQILTLLLSQQAISLRNTRLQYETLKGELLELSPLQLSLQHDGRLHQLQLDAQLASDQNPTRLHLSAEVEGNPAKSPIRLHLVVDDLNQTVLNPWLGLADIQLDSLQASLQLWGQVQAGRIEYLIGSTQLSELHHAAFQLNQLQLKTALLRRNTGYQLQILDASVGESHHLELPFIGLNVVIRGQQILPEQLLLDRMLLAELQAWLNEHRLLPEQLGEILTTLAPTGEVSNLRVKWPQPDDWLAFEAEADLQSVSIQAWHDVPALKGINGLLRVNRSGGEIHLNSDDFELFFPTLYRAPWHYDKANGVISWHLRDDDVVVASQLLHLSDQYVSAAGRFSISLPYSRDEQPSLTLMIGMENSDGAQAQHYIPPHAVGDNLYVWLVKALQGGQVERAGLVLNGDTRSRLEDFQPPSLLMFYDTKAVEFAYQPDWPPVKDTDAFVFYRNGDLLVEALGGSIYDTRIGYVNAFMPSHSPELYIKGNLTGDLSDLSRLLAETPLKETVGDGFSSWQMGGATNTLLQLAIPVTSAGKLGVRVNGELNQGLFLSPELGLNFSNLAGSVQYDSRLGLSSRGITGQLFGKPVKSTITTEAGGSTRINLDGSVAIDVIRKWLNLDILQIASGTAQYKAGLELCPKQACRQLSLTSDLKGVAIKAPEGLGKSKENVSAFDLVTEVGGASDKPRLLRFNLGQQLSAVVQTQFGVIRKARFTLGDASPKLPDFDGIWVDGYLPRVEFAQLNAFLTDSALLASTDKQPKGAVLQEVKVSTAEFDLGGLTLDNLSARVIPDNLGWMINGEADQLSGRLLLPTDTEQPMQLKLDRLVWKKADKTEAQAEVEKDPLPGMNPGDLPKMDIDIAALFLDEKPLGNWSLQLRPQPNHLNVEQIRGDMFGTQVTGELDWQQNGKKLTELSLNLKSEDFGKALKAWGYAKALETEKLKGYAQLSWPGAPWDFELAELNGQVDFNARNGRLLDVGNSGNLLRVFGILNLQSLTRRLRLDFTDLFKSGVAFDAMDASYQIERGIARTRTPFVMKGPSANMALTGQLDLVQETVDKDIEVALPVTGNIPLVSVLLGAPQVAGAVFLLDKLIGDPLEKFTTVRYHLNGSWTNPEADFSSLPDANKAQDKPGPVLPESGG